MLLLTFAFAFCGGILLAFCLIIGCLILLRELVSGITLAAHHDCSDASAGYAKEDDHEDNPNEARHEFSGTKLVTICVLKGLELSSPGCAVNSRWLLKLSASGDAASSGEAPEEAGEVPDDTVEGRDAREDETDHVDEASLGWHVDVEGDDCTDDGNCVE